MGAICRTRASGEKMKHTFEVEVTATKTARPVVVAEMKVAIEKAVYDWLEDLLEPDGLNVNVEESG